MIHKWFKRVMTLINCLLTIPVIWVLIRELAGPGRAEMSKVLAALALVGLPLCGTIAITITGCAVLAED